MNENRSFASSGGSELVALGEARKRGISSDDFGFAYILSEAANLAKVVIAKEKVVAIVIILRIYMANVLIWLTEPDAASETNERQQSGLEHGQCYSVCKLACVVLVLTPRMYHQWNWKNKLMMTMSSTLMKNLVYLTMK